MTEEKYSNNDGGIWLSIKELAERKGVSKQAMSQRVKRLADDGLIEVRQVGRFREIELVAFDRAVGQAGNALREQSADSRRSDASSASPALRDAQTNRAIYEARLKQLDYEERVGNLIPVKGPKGLEEALVKTAEVIVKDMDIPLQSAAELYEAACKGEKELRIAIRSVILKMRQAICEKLMALKVAAENEGPYEIYLKSDDEP